MPLFDASASTMPARSRSDKPEIVRSYTEWDPLEEVVVGRLAGGVFPTWQSSMRATMPEESWRLFERYGGSPLPGVELKAAERELDDFAAALEYEGVNVVRTEPTDHAVSFSTPHWQSAGGLYAGMPRDLLMVVGDAIIEAPMSWRCRYHEIDAFRPLIKSYFERGARWLPEPRPQLTDELFAPYDESDDGGYAVTEFEPVFDAADFVRFGRDIVAQKSRVTNEFGIRWLERAVGDAYRVHCVEVTDPHAMHIDATIVPLAPGKLLVNPERFVPHELFRDWEILEAPKPALPSGWPMYFCPLNFRHVYSFGGSFHCVTLDIRRRGDNDTYLAC